jgi:hypothetical protein
VANAECNGAPEGSSEVAERDDEGDTDGTFVVAVPDCDEVNNACEKESAHRITHESLVRTRKKASFKDSDQKPQDNDRGTVLHSRKSNGQGAPCE